MNDIILLDELRSRGYEHPDIRRMVRSGELVRLRRAAYAQHPPDGPIGDKHRQLVHATIPYLGDDTVISHGSAAALHGLPLWPPAVSHVHVTRSRKYGGKLRTVVHVHAATLTADDVVLVDGVRVTSIARTVLDLGRTLPLAQSVAGGDRALATGVSPDELARTAAGMEHWPGIRRARHAVELLDRRSESAGESASRVELLELSLPRPDLQVRILDANGRLVARSDFGWLDRRTVGEFDGKIKYGRALEPGRSIEDIVYEEKLREDAIRDLGWQVVRWTWSDLQRSEVIRDRLLRAFARAGSEPGSGAASLPSYRP